MCLSPIKVVNKWYCPSSDIKKRDLFEKRYPYWFLHDTSNFYINVPCGLCAQCLQARQNEFVQRCYFLSKYSWTLFGTLTYNNESLPRLYVNGYDLKFAAISDFQNFIKRLRKHKILPSFRYLCVSEYGDDKVINGVIRTSRHRPHFHFMIFVPFQSKEDFNNEFKGFEFAKNVLDFIVSPAGWSRNYSTSSQPLYIPCSSFIMRQNSSTYDCHLVTGENREDVAYYVTKYVLKFSDYVNRLQSALKLNLPIDEYYRVWKIVRPRVLCSKGLGIKQVQDTDWPFAFVDECIDEDISSQIDLYSLTEESPSVNIAGNVVPLCKYFCDRLLTLNQAVSFHNNNYGNPFTDESFVEDYDSIKAFDNDYYKKQDTAIKFEKLKKSLDNNLY